MVEALFEDFDGYLEKQGYLAMGRRSSTRRLYRSPSSATAVTTYGGSRMARRLGGLEGPAGQAVAEGHGRTVDKRSRRRPLRFKNHVNVDRRHKLVRRYQVTDAAVHDSQVVEDILDPDNTASDVSGGRAYRSARDRGEAEGEG